MFQNIKTQIVEVPFNLNDTRQRVSFPTQDFLRAKQIISIEVFTSVELPLAPVSLQPLPTSAQMKSAFLTLYGDNPENPGAKGVWIDNVPMWTLHRTNDLTNPYVRDVYSLVPRNITWEKSFIWLTAPLGNTGTPITFTFLVGYSGNEGDNNLGN